MAPQKIRMETISASEKCKFFECPSSGLWVPRCRSHFQPIRRCSQDHVVAFVAWLASLRPWAGTGPFFEAAAPPGSCDFRWLKEKHKERPARCYVWSRLLFWRPIEKYVTCNKLQLDVWPPNIGLSIIIYICAGVLLHHPFPSGIDYPPNQNPNLPRIR